MKAEQAQLIQEATRVLRLRDVVLSSSSFHRPSAPPEGEFEARQHTKRSVTFIVGDLPGATEPSQKRLQVIVSLGLRIAGAESEDPPVYIEIEADFMVEYELSAILSEDAIKLFAEANSVHNVWPFWRQHIFDIVSRARLPQLEVPLFSVLPLPAE